MEASPTLYLVTDEMNKQTPETTEPGNYPEITEEYPEPQPFILDNSQQIHPDFIYNKHNEAIFDAENYFPSLQFSTNGVVKFDDNNPDLINHATIKALVVQLTSPEVIDYNLICDFFLTYRIFTDSESVLNLLLTRLIWSLQYIKSSIPSNVKTGQLVLLRTFVVIRHWLLNYFIDDFEPNPHLCDTFIFHINKITNESKLVDTSMIFECKIISDLKIHWLSIINEFWSVNVDIDTIITKEEVLLFPMPSISEVSNLKKIPKTNTEMSIHTNPAYRRSAMLSLYDQKTHHKCLILDEKNTSDENPQFSINNLLLQHQCSRVSLNNKLQQFQEKKLRDSKEKPSNKPLVNKHNHMNLKDSSLALKKTNAVNTTTPARLVKSPESDKENVNSDPVDLSGMDNESEIGFSTSGNVKLPTSKVRSIVPPTPAKKMEYIIKNSLVGSPKRKTRDSIDDLNDIDDMNRKKSIKKLMEGWRKTFNNKTPSTSSAHSGSTHDLDTLINSAMNAMPEEQQTEIGSRVDILSARIIDELEYLIKFYIHNELSPSRSTKAINEDNESMDQVSFHTSYNGNDDEFVEVKSHNGDSILGSPRKKYSLKPVSQIRENDTEEEEEDLNINDLSDLNIGKIDNLINTKKSQGASQDELANILDEIEEQDANEPSLGEAVEVKLSAEITREQSFQRPTSINWNEDPDFETSAMTNDDSIGKTGELTKDLNDEVDEVDEVGENDGASLVETSSTSKRKPLGKCETQYFDVSDELPAQVRPSNKSEGSFALSISTPSNITQYDAEIADLGIAMSPQSLKENGPRRISFNVSTNVNRRISRTSSSSIFKRDSAKSYLSYDSALSFSNRSSGGAKDDFLHDNGLRKKTGYNNLRGIAHVRNGSGDYGVIKIKTPSSRSSSVRKSIRVSALRALAELPFTDENRNTMRDASNADDSSIFSLAAKSKHESARVDRMQSVSTTSTNSVAIPGISHYVLKELAAIPDESIRLNNPIEFALHKLEGKHGHVVESEKDDETVDDVEKILDEINNANTQDVIDFSTDIEATPEPPLTPAKPRRSENFESEPATSTPRKTDDTEDDIFFFNSTTVSQGSPGVSRSPFVLPPPKVILDGYHITADLLSVKNAMDNEGTHISFVLSFDSVSLANHFTIIEKDMLQEIDWKELIELKWNKELSPVNSWLEIIVNETYYNSNKGVNLVISRFNLMVNWIISEILLTKLQTERINVISRFIHVAQNCLVLQNFSTLMQIILALTSEKMTKLKDTWNNLSPGDILMLKNLEELSSPLKNFLNIRLAINQIKPSKGCIPFVGLYLSDLIFNAERPKHIKNAKTSPKPPVSDTESNNTVTNNSTGTVVGPSSEDDKMINFSRFRTSVHIVKSLSQCIEWSSYYKFQLNRELLSKCLYIKSLDEEEMNFCLNHLLQS